MKIIDADKLWQHILDEYSHRDMLTFDEIKELFDNAPEVNNTNL